jgi:pimeloyl-ACP methyl ester carboxylesterase
MPALVFLVHGFLRTGLSMVPLARGLRRHGFETVTVTQWNLQPGIPQLADALYERVERERDRAAARAAAGCGAPACGRPDAHFVTHSMGGIVVRSMLARHALDGPNRVVMLAPPIHGSRFAAHMRDRVLRLPWGRFDPLRKLLPGELGDCEGAGDPDAEIGIIAGAPARASGFPWSFKGLDAIGAAAGEHDGKVTLEEARWDRATDFRVVPYGHSFIMARGAVVDECAAFLRTGRFLAEGAGAGAGKPALPDEACGPSGLPL